MRRNKLLERKDVEDLSKEPLPPPPSQGIQWYLPSFGPWLGDGGLRTSQEGVAEEDQATETKISNKLGQGNPVWVQL